MDAPERRSNDSLPRGAWARRLILRRRLKRYLGVWLMAVLVQRRCFGRGVGAPIWSGVLLNLLWKLTGGRLTADVGCRSGTVYGWARSRPRGCCCDAGKKATLSGWSPCTPTRACLATSAATATLGRESAASRCSSTS